MTATGLTCFFCGYDLRGLAEEGSCPECGATVASSKRGDRWDWADERWVRQVRRGALWAAAEYFVLLAGLLNAFVPSRWDHYFVAILYGVMGLCAVVSGWRITAREPEATQGRRMAIIRWLSIGVGVGYAIIITTVIVQARSWYQWTVVTAIAGLVGMALSNGLKQWMQLGYLRELMGRVPGRRTGRWSKILRWSPLIGWWMMAGGQLVVDSIGDPWRGLYVVVAVGLLLGTAVYDVVIWWILRVR